jgi:hypothetical protein
MGEITDIAKSSESVPEKAKQAASIIVDKAVDKAKKESGSTASAVKSFIAGMFATLLVLKGCVN